MRAFRRVLVVLVLVMVASPAAPADLLGGLQSEESSVADTAEIVSLLDKLTALYLLRFSFNVLDYEEIEPAITQELEGLIRSPGEAAVGLDQKLLIETGYFLTSLRYLVLSGGAIWPPDRADQSYERDAMVMLDALEDQLLETYHVSGDPLATLLSAQELRAQTEGYAAVPEELDVFSRRDQLAHEIGLSLGIEVR